MSVIAFITWKYISWKSIPDLYKKPCVTSSALYFTILFLLVFSLHFHTNIHMYSTSAKPSRVLTCKLRLGAIPAPDAIALNCWDWELK